MNKLVFSSLLVLALANVQATPTTDAVTQEVQAAITTTATQDVQAAPTDAATQELKAVMKHANPMPNLMIVVKKQGDMLELSKEQKQSLDEWTEKHAPTVKKLAFSIKNGEAILHEAALDGASKDMLTAMLDTILKKREEIVELKTDCRNHLREILNGEQWEKLLKLYKEM
jgi:4-hydroxyphenylpyruvate dioxygenase-like putative hemolysin